MVNWSEYLSVKHEGIDEQHKKLILIMEEVSNLVNDKERDFNHILEIVTDLDSYLEEHLKYEEALMEKISYPDSAEHIKQHNALREKITAINVFQVGNTESFYKDLLAYLVEWLLNHIMNTDKKLGAFLCEKMKVR